MDEHQNEPRKIKYSLYELDVTTENIEKASKERFSRVTTDYVLIYKAGRKPNGARRISDEESNELDLGVKLWLSDCNTTIVVEEAKKNVPAVAEKMSEILDKFEEELESKRGVISGAE